MRLSAAALWVPLAVALAAHAPALTSGWIADDDYLVVQNAQVQAGAPGLWTTDWFDTGNGVAIGYYRPLVKASFRLTRVLFGPEPLAFHAGNLLLHLLAVAALALLLAQWVPAPAAALGASVFAAHPMTVQGVSIVTARSDVLSGAALLWACVLFAQSLEGRRAAAFFAPIALLLALWSKEAAALGLLPLAWLGFAHGLSPRELVRKLLPFAGAVGVALAMRLAAGVHPISNGLATHLVDAARLGLAALGHTVWPLLTGAEIVRLPPAAGWGFAALGAALAAALVAFAWVSRERTVAFGPLLLLASVAPALAVTYVHIPRLPGELPIAERWLYLPVAALGVLAAHALAATRRRSVVAAAALVPLALGAISFSRSLVYRDHESFQAYRTELLRALPPGELTDAERYHLLVLDGAELARAERWAEALALFQEAVALNDYLPAAWTGVADCTSQLGQLDEAQRALERLLAPNPRALATHVPWEEDAYNRLDRAPMFARLGLILARRGDLPRAHDALGRAVRLARTEAERKTFQAQLDGLAAAPGPH